MGVAHRQRYVDVRPGEGEFGWDEFLSAYKPTQRVAISRISILPQVLQPEPMELDAGLRGLEQAADAHVELTLD